MSLATVVIPTWNGRCLLDACLAGLGGQTWRDFEIVIVDNGSTDGTASWMQDRYPDVQVIANDRNLGFAAAVNQGIRASASRYVVTLNNDTEPAPGWLAALVATAERDPSVGMCASKMLFADRPGVINSTGIYLDRTGIAWDRRGGEPDDERGTEPVEVFGPCGGAALYRRTMLDEVGLFEEDFFAYLEDVDLAWRARLAGWRCLYVPAARGFAPSFCHQCRRFVIQAVSPGPQQGLAHRQELPLCAVMAIRATAVSLRFGRGALCSGSSSRYVCPARAPCRGGRRQAHVAQTPAPQSCSAQRFGLSEPA